MSEFDPSLTSMDERETIIIIRDKTASIYSCDGRWVNKLEKKYTATKEDKYGKWFEVPADNIKIGPKREMTEEQRAAAAERFKNIRKSKAEVVKDDEEI